MAAAPQQSFDADQITKLHRQIKRLWIVFGTVALVLLVLAGSLSYFAWQKSKTLSTAVEDLQFSDFVNYDSQSTDYVTPTVNVIQFMRRGYTVNFDYVQYTQDGLVLGGQIGNGTQLWVSSLALNFAARPYPYKIRDKWAKDKDFFLYSSQYDIGKAQTTVGTLNPGSTASFRVTIPNVKQTPEDIRIAISFSGERYQYLGSVR